jgi:hypothetical protein
VSTVERDNAGTAVQLPPELSVPPAETKTEVKSDERVYVVMKQGQKTTINSENAWQFIANIEATSAEQAVRRAAEQPGSSFLNADGTTTLVAIPVRSFNPVTVSVKTETTIVLS